MSSPLPAPVSLQVESVRTTVLDVPLRYVLGTSAAVVSRAPIVLVDIVTKEGAIGHAYVFGYRATAARAIALLIDDAIALVAGRAVEPRALGAFIARR
ncbi:MAG: hypothetical protein H7125_08345, partial [Proteobacteria bacterium]|nr:hypothetical protein [Burkholderiales bacterium]